MVTNTPIAPEAPASAPAPAPARELAYKVISGEENGTDVGLVEYAVAAPGIGKSIEQIGGEGIFSLINVASSDSRGMVLWSTYQHDPSKSDQVGLGYSWTASLSFHTKTSRGISDPVRYDLPNAYYHGFAATLIPGTDGNNTVLLVDEKVYTDIDSNAVIHAELIGKDGVIWKGPEVKVPYSDGILGVEWLGEGSQAKVTFVNDGVESVINIPTTH